MVLTSAASALSSIKAAYDIAKGTYSLQVSTEVKLAISDMLDKLVDAKRQGYEALEREEALLERINALEAEIRNLKEEVADLENYEPKRFYPGVTAYTLKPALAEGRHPHKLCENCYSKGKKSELHATAKQERRYRQHICPSCNTEYYMGGEVPPDGPAEESRAEATIVRGESSWVSARRGNGPNDWMAR